MSKFQSEKVVGSAFGLLQALRPFESFLRLKLSELVNLEFMRRIPAGFSTHMQCDAWEYGSVFLRFLRFKVCPVQKVVW